MIKLFLYYRFNKNQMKSIIGILPLFLLLIAAPAISSVAFAQNNISNSTGNGTGGAAGGGLSTNSVNIAKSNSKDLTGNSTAKGTGTGGAGGLSTNSVNK